MNLTPAMHHAEIGINAGMLALLIIPAFLYFGRAISQRRSRPELLQNGLWFVLPFLLFPVMWLFTLAVAPVAFVTAIISAFFRSKTAKHILFLSLGELTASMIGIVWLALINTYTIPQR